MRRDDAIALFGTQQKLAEELGCAQSTVAEWKPDLIPLKRAMQIAQIKGVTVNLSAYGIQERSQ